MRFPDFYDETAHLIADSKNVARLSYTSQLRDYVGLAKANGWDSVVVFIRQNTVTTGPIDTAVENGEITLIRLFPTG